jgi:hypothetical protein
MENYYTKWVIIQVVNIIVKMCQKNYKKEEMTHVFATRTMSCLWLLISPIKIV